MFIDNELINEIRSKTDIVEVIGEYVPLTKKGKNYFGVCPFHDDHNPSMSVSSEKQIYTCFSCGAGGNVFTFLQDYEHLSFPEAVLEIGKRIGIDVNVKGKTTSHKHNKAYEMYEISNKFYLNNLKSKEGKLARDYLEKRGFSKQVIEDFQIGLSLNNISVTKLLREKGYEGKDIYNYGLSTEVYEDIFYERIMFPLWDIKGQVVAFSGRVYKNDSDNKYVNTKETNIFKKGQMLYNYHLAKTEARSKNYVIVCEGFMDVIRLSIIGINNAVALMGTAFTKEQAMLLKKFSSTIYLLFDGDDAGDIATKRAIEMLEQMDFNIKIIKLEEGLDPDDYIVKYGEKKFYNLIKNALNVFDYKMISLKEDKNLSLLSDQSKFINEALAELSKIEDLVLRELNINKIAKEFQIEESVLRNKLNKYKVKDKVVVKERKKDKLNKYEKAERLLIFYMLQDKEVINMYEKEVTYLPTLKMRYLANEISYMFLKNDSYSLADFMTHVEDKPELKETLLEILNQGYKEEYTLLEIEDYLETLKEYVKKYKIKTLEKDLIGEIDINKQKEILLNIIKIKKEKEND